jgi:hypothetical protein
VKIVGGPTFPNWSEVSPTRQISVAQDVKPEAPGGVVAVGAKTLPPEEVSHRNKRSNMSARRHIQVLL